MTSAVDERGARHREILDSANGVVRLVPHRVRLEHRSGLAAFDWAIGRKRPSRSSSG